MIIKKLTLGGKGFPEELRHIAAPPQQLYTVGAPLEELMRRPRIAIVGTRSMTPYGQQVTTDLARKLAGRGAVIISGLALGVDAQAHRAALEAGGTCIAVLPGPADNIVPIRNRPLARRLWEAGGALVSEYAPGTPPYKQNFIARNRLVSGLAQAVLITEASAKSGSLYTANFAVEQGRDVLVVPGDIYSPGSVGTHNLVKQGQAGLVTSYKDILQALGLEDGASVADPAPPRGRTGQEQIVLDLLARGVREGERLLENSRLPVAEFNQTLTMLEISGFIRPLGANQWSLC
jgi:DNA processing protein